MLNVEHPLYTTSESVIILFTVIVVGFNKINLLVIKSEPEINASVKVHTDLTFKISSEKMVKSAILPVSAIAILALSPKN